MGENGGKLGDGVGAVQTVAQVWAAAELAGAASGDQRRQGLLVHSALAVSTRGVPLGLLAQRVWTRPPVPRQTRQQRRRRATADKESARWQQAEAAGLADVPLRVRVVTVADREGDIYD